MLEEIGALTLKGLTQPVVARELLNLSPFPPLIGAIRWVESGCGAVVLGRPCRLPPLSSGGALVGRP